MKEKIEFTISTLRASVEFGFKGHESGKNLQQVLIDFDKIMRCKK